MFKVSRVRTDGSRTTLDHLGRHELDQWMAENYGKFETVEITREDTGRCIIYTDDGSWWDRV